MNWFHNTVQHFTNYPFQAIGRYFRPLDYCTTYTFKKGYFRGNGDIPFMYNSLQTKTIGNSKFNVLIPYSKELRPSESIEPWKSKV